MKALFILSLLFASFSSYGQAVNKIIYCPDGKQYKGNAVNIAQLNKEMEERGRVYVFSPNVNKGDDLTTIGYKLFTNKPLWIITEDTLNIRSNISKFNLGEFLTSWEFENEVKKYVEKGSLTDIFLLNTLGKPESKKKASNGKATIEYWEYNTPGITLVLKNGVVHSYVKNK